MLGCFWFLASLRCDPCGVSEENSRWFPPTWLLLGSPGGAPSEEICRDLPSVEICPRRQAVIESLCAVCSGVFIVLLLYAVLYLLSTCCMQALTQFYPQYEQMSRDPEGQAGQSGSLLSS